MTRHHNREEADSRNERPLSGVLGSGRAAVTSHNPVIMLNGRRGRPTPEIRAHQTAEISSASRDTRGNKHTNPQETPQAAFRGYWKSTKTLESAGVKGGARLGRPRQSRILRV